MAPSHCAGVQVARESIAEAVGMGTDRMKFGVSSARALTRAPRYGGRTQRAQMATCAALPLEGRGGDSSWRATFGGGAR